RSGADVVGVPVAVDHVRDGLVGDVLDSSQHVLAQRWRGIDRDDALFGHDERRIIAAAGDPVETVAQLFDMVAELLEALAPEVGRIVFRRVARMLAGLGEAVSVDAEKPGSIRGRDRLLMVVAHDLLPSLVEGGPSGQAGGVSKRSTALMTRPAATSSNAVLISAKS